MNISSKYIILIGDGMADYPVESLGNRTLLQAAGTPNMDRIAQNGICGLAKTVPDGMNPGSDTANLSIFGYNPRESYSGRAPLEAINMGIELGPDDTAFRCNIVNTEGGVMNDFTSDHIDSGLSEVIMAELSRHNRISGLEFHAGVSYRNILIWRGYPHRDITDATPPHDIQGKETAPYLPSGQGSDTLQEIMNLSEEVIRNSDAVKDAQKKYRGTPSSVWLWGGGRKPMMKTLDERFGLKGYTISAVDLINGIGKAAGLSPVSVEGATGYIDTNYTGKADALLEVIKTCNYVYLHVESPDESGHEGDIDHKLQSIEDFDEKVVGRVLNGMSGYDDYTILVMPDHPTPVSVRTHTSDPVPFCIYKSRGWDTSPYAGKCAPSYDEEAAAGTGLYVEEGHRMIELMINGRL